MAQEIWKKRGVDVRLGSATELPFDDGEFDTVVSSHVIEHVKDDEKAIEEMARVAKKRLLVVVPEGNVDAKNFGSKHLRYYDRVNFCRLFEKVDSLESQGYSLPHSHMNNLIMEVNF